VLREQSERKGNCPNKAAIPVEAQIRKRPHFGDTYRVGARFC